MPVEQLCVFISIISTVQTQTPSKVSIAIKAEWQLIQLWSATAVIRNGRRFTWRFRGNDVSIPLKRISSFPLSPHGFLASLHASLVGGTKTQGWDASEGNEDAIKRFGMHNLSVLYFLVLT